MSMLTSNYGAHRPRTIEENRLNNSNHITLIINAQPVDHPIKHNSLLRQDYSLPRIRSFIVTLCPQYTSQDQNNAIPLH